MVISTRHIKIAVGKEDIFLLHQHSVFQGQSVVLVFCETTLKSTLAANYNFILMQVFLLLEERYTQSLQLIN